MQITMGIHASSTGRDQEALATSRRHLSHAAVPKGVQGGQEGQLRHGVCIRTRQFELFLNGEKVSDHFRSGLDEI